MVPEPRLGLLKPELGRIKAYQPEETPARVLLDANENSFPLPAAWLEEAREAVAGLALNRYPDPRALELRREAAKAYGVAEESILLGNGSDELIQLAAAAFARPGASCLIPVPTFSMFKVCALGQGLEPVEEPLGEDFDLTPAFLSKAAARAPALIFLAMPNNPTGNVYSRAAVEELLALPGSVVVADEAYAEFSGTSLLELLPSHPNLVVLRTFSKAYGLAGLRLGLCFAHPRWIAEFEKIRLPYNVNAVTQALGALALRHRAVFQEVIARILEGRDLLQKGLAGLAGVQVYPSRANFLLFRCPRAEGLHAWLLKAGIRVRSFRGQARLDGCLRVTAGQPHENREFLDAVHSYYGA